VIGDLKAAPSLWLTDTATLEGLAAGGGGTIALAMSGISSEGVSALMLSEYEPQAGGWGRPSTLISDWNATSAPAFVGGTNGDVAVSYAEPVPKIESVDLPGGEKVDVAGLPELARVSLVRLPALLTGVTTQPQAATSTDATIWLVAGGAALVVALLGGVLLFRRRA
jgi:LPXTG-motif cell wall-anchored protein